MTEKPKRRSVLASSSEQPSGESSIEQFVARANAELAAVATAHTLQSREAREDELRREVDELRARHARELEALEARVAGRRRRARVMIAGAFVLGAAAMFGIDLARAPSRDVPPQAAIAPPRPPAAPPPAPPPPAAAVVAPAPAIEAPPAAVASTAVAPVASPPPPVVARPAKKKAQPRSGSPAPQPAAEDLVNPF